MYDAGVVGALRDAVNDLEVHPDSRELTELLALRDRLDATLSAGLADFDVAGLWELNGRTSLRDWLRVHGRMRAVTAGIEARTAQRLRDLPVTRRAWLDGGLSSDQVRIIVRPLTGRRRPAFAEAEANLVPLLGEMDCRETERVMHEWVEAFDAANPGPDPDEPANTCFVARTIAERGELRGSFESTSTTVIEAALAVAETKDAAGELRLPAERRADALVDICRHYLDTHTRPRRRRHAPHVSLVLTLEQLEAQLSGHTIDGHHIPAPGIATLACDSVVRRVVMAGGELIELGRLTPTVPPKLFDAVATRDRGCRYPGCDRPPKWCDAHHVHPWEHGGITGVSNLVLLCRRHHTRIHHRGTEAKLLPDATLEITLPTGQVLRTRPPPPGPLFQ
jgi:hypothetical protein